MKVGKVDVNNLTTFKVNIAFLKKIAKKVLEKEGKSEYNLSVVLVDEKTIRVINKKYRKKDQATDVLSFVYFRKDDFPKNELLGEIVICPSQTKKNEKGIVRVLIHGILHLLGYDHEKKGEMKKEMEDKEKKYNSFFINLSLN